MSTMTLTIERTPRTLQFTDGDMQVEELSIRLPFARKAVDLKEASYYGATKVYITESRAMTPSEFDAFANSLTRSREWLRGKGGGDGDGYLCVEVTAPGRPTLYINPEGGDYARYVARLG